MDSSVRFTKNVTNTPVYNNVKRSYGKATSESGNPQNFEFCTINYFGQLK